MEFSRQEYWSGCHSLPQGIFLTQGLNLGILRRRLILHHLSHQGSPMLARKRTKGDFQHSALSFLNCSSTLSVWFKLLSCVRLFATPWTAARQASLSITNSCSLPKLMSVESVMPSNHLILCHPLLPPSILPSIRVFSNESILCIRWTNYWSFSFSISPSNEYSGLISFRMEWLDLLAVQGTLKSLLQHHSSKATVLWGLVQLTFIHDYWKNHGFD